MKRILCFGDSNTWGYAPKDGYRFDENTRWTGLLQNALPDYKIIEEGLNGRTAVWDDPIEGYKNGKPYLIPCLDIQFPNKTSPRGFIGISAVIRQCLIVILLGILILLLCPFQRSIG